jgi:hypothetical protein
MKDRILDTSSYGFCLFSTETLIDFLKNNKIRSKKLLDVFSKNHDLYLQSLVEGVWFPISPISSVKYNIKCGENEQFDQDWQHVFSLGAFNLAIGKDNAFWIGCKGNFSKFEAPEFVENTEGFSSYQTLDGVTIYNSFKIEAPAGKYLVNMHGFKRKKEQDYPEANYGYWLDLQAVKTFNAYEDPREDDKYNFNISTYQNPQTITLSESKIVDLLKIES